MINQSRMLDEIANDIEDLPYTDFGEKRVLFPKRKVIPKKGAGIPNLDALPDSAFITRNELAALCGFENITFRRWAKINKGPKITRIEGRPRYMVGHVKEWMNR